MCVIMLQACSQLLECTQLQASALVQACIHACKQLPTLGAEITPADIKFAFAAMITTCLYCRPGKLLRFDVGPGGLQTQHGQPTGADLKFTGVANQRRGRADVYSKVPSYVT